MTENEQVEIVTTKFSIQSICKLDSELNRSVEQKIKEIVSDCLQRPATKGKRSLTITFDFKPNENKHDRIDVSAKVSSKTPARQFDPVSAKVNINDSSIEFSHVQGELFSDFAQEEGSEDLHDGKAKAAGE